MNKRTKTMNFKVERAKVPKGTSKSLKTIKTKSFKEE
jgi:hypothetical protein